MLKKLTRTPDYLFYINNIRTEYFKNFKSVYSYYIPEKSNNKEILIRVYTRNSRENYFNPYNDYICITIEFMVKPFRKPEKSKKGKSTDKYFEAFVEDLIKQFNVTKADITKHTLQYRASFKTKENIEYILVAEPKDGRTGSKGFICRLTKTVYLKQFF